MALTLRVCCYVRVADHGLLKLITAMFK